MVFHISHNNSGIVSGFQNLLPSSRLVHFISRFYNCFLGGDIADSASIQCIIGVQLRFLSTAFACDVGINVSTTHVCSLLKTE